MPDTFTPPIQPDYDSDTDSDHKPIVITYGEDTEQRRQRSITKDPKKNIMLSWGSLTIAQADEIEGFINDKAGVEAFFIDCPRFANITHRYVCEKFKRKPVKPEYDMISAEFRRIFI